MRIRDADEEDAPMLATLADAPVEVMRNIVHDRTVRVAEHEDGDEVDDGVEVDDGDETDDGNNIDDEVEADETDGVDRADTWGIVGYVSFDAERDTVFVTQLNGKPTALERLLEEPIRFGRREAMAIELLVTSEDEHVRSVARSAGFECAGDGPSFKNGPTKRYRIEPPER